LVNEILGALRLEKHPDKTFIGRIGTSASRADHKSASLPSALVTRYSSPKRNRPDSSAAFRRCLSSRQSRRNDQISASAGQSRRRRHTHAKAPSSTASEARAAVSPAAAV
jgi:hypothetical protein